MSIFLLLIIFLNNISVSAQLHLGKGEYLHKAVSFIGILSDVYGNNERLGMELIGFKGNKVQHIFIAGYSGLAYCSLDHSPEIFSKYKNTDYELFDSDNEKFILKVCGDITGVGQEIVPTFWGNINKYWIEISNGFIQEINEKKIEDYEMSNDGEKTTETTDSSSATSKSDFLSGNWHGEMGGKPLLISINEISANNIKGYNKLGDNKRSIEGTFVDANWDQPCSVAYSAVLSEPGDDEWDGVFTIKFIGYNDEVEGEYGPECKPNTFVSFEAMGEWKSNNGKLERTFILTKTQ